VAVSIIFIIIIIILTGGRAMSIGGPLTREGESDGYCQRKALGHSDDEDGDSRDEEAKHFRPMHVVIPGLLAAVLAKQGLLYLHMIRGSRAERREWRN